MKWVLLGLGALGAWGYYLSERRIADGVLRGYAADFVLKSEHPAYSIASDLSYKTGLPPSWVADLWQKGLRGDRLVEASWAASDALEEALRQSADLSPDRLAALKAQILGRL